MLYPRSGEDRLSEQLFENPTSEYRGTPFWAWNGRLNDETLSRQIQMLREMGMGGFHMHVRTGMDSPYLDGEFMGHVRHCVEEARQNKMLAWLYDEDRWPSGTAGGKVTAKDPAFAMQMLVLTVTPCAGDDGSKTPGPGNGQRSARQENGIFLAAYDVKLNGDGRLVSYRRIGENEPAEGTKWYAYQEHAAEDPWFNGRPYADTLSTDAVRTFIDITHEAYYRELKNDFGSTVPSIFTDEPKAARKRPLAFPGDTENVVFPWTWELPDLFEKEYSEDILDKIPELVWENADGSLSQFRWRFHNYIAERFARNYCGQIGSWCDARGIKFTGHCDLEPTLRGQTNAMGDAMRCYPHFGIPGIDMLCDFHEYTTAKQTQSIVRQCGKEGMLSELYGVTGWDYDFRGYKLQGDWQAALGVTVRVPHLTWMTMKGEAKRDYPASIGYQSPWWKEFSMVEDHFARLNTAMTRGKAVAKVAVIHPIESYWLYWGPMAQTEAERSRMESQFKELTEMLLFGLIDFDFISEAVLPEQCEKGACPLRVGQMSYDAVIAPGLTTLRSTTLDRLESFVDAGGRLLFTGDAPTHVDALPSDRAKKLFMRGERLDFSKTAILSALEDLRFIDIRDDKGVQADTLLYQLRQDKGGMWLFVANGKNPPSPDVENDQKLRFILNGEYKLTLYDTVSGDIRPLDAAVSEGRTVFEKTWHLHDSLLLWLEPAQERTRAPEFINIPSRDKQAALIMEPVRFRLSEPNMCLLDMGEYALDGGEWQPKEEILRMDNAARRALGIPPRRKEVMQPYLIPDEPNEHFIDVRFTIPSEVEVPCPYLALEDPELARICLNGETVDTDVTGWFVDRDIKRIALPGLKKGENVLTVRTPIGKRTNLEAFYLLGDFGVRVNGTVKTLIPLPEKLGFGSVVEQGLPFYTGNVEYIIPVNACGDFAVRVPHWRGGLVKAFVDGKDAGMIAFSPYRLEIKGLEPGRHELVLRLYGTRINSFGQLHHTQGIYYYQSPNSWRSEGDLWKYEYEFNPMGILKSPELSGAVPAKQ
ncbi:MAG: hypothetical protein IKI24_04900 [Clostridia bacterium]|nr:hypothetical protein [Clostridia bacterium]